jgi:hypothetical protein
MNEILDKKEESGSKENVINWQMKELPIKKHQTLINEIMISAF